MKRSWMVLVSLTGLLAAGGAPAQDRSVCTGIYCPQIRAADTTAELAPYMAPGKTWEQVKGRATLVMKYYNRDGTLASTRTFPQTAYMQPFTARPGKIAFAGQGTPTVVLYGLEPCARKGSFDFKGERLTCDTLWQERLSDKLYGAQVVLCRAYSDQVERSAQDATCIRSNESGGRLAGGVVIDDALVGIGAATLERDASGKPFRPELVSAEKSGQAILAGAGR